MRMRLIVETDFIGTREQFRDKIRSSIRRGIMSEFIPGEVVYVATDVAETAVVSHDGKVLTQG